MVQHRIDVEPGGKLVRVKYVGDLDLAGIMPVVTEARQTALDLGCPLFYDFTECKVGVTLSAGFAFPRNLAILQGPEMKKMRVALFVPQERDATFWEFYETTAVNAGLNLRIFRDEPEALRWLRHEKET